MSVDKRKRIVIMGAEGRDFHNFNVVYRDDASIEVIAFAAAQIPDIANRRYPAVLAGGLYPDGIPVVDEAELDRLCREHTVDQMADVVVTPKPTPLPTLTFSVSVRPLRGSTQGRRLRCRHAIARRTESSGRTQTL